MGDAAWGEEEAPFLWSVTLQGCILGLLLQSTELWFITDPQYIRADITA